METQSWLTWKKNPWSKGVHGLVCWKVYSTGQWHFVTRHCKASIYSRSEEFLLLKGMKSGDEDFCVCMTDFYWAENLCLHQYCSWVEEGMCRDLHTILPCVFRMAMLLGGWRGRRRTFGIINQRICLVSDTVLGGWIIALSICYTECPVIAAFFPSFNCECCWFIWRVQQQICKHFKKALGVLALRFTLDIGSSRWSCWQPVKE